MKTEHLCPKCGSKAIERVAREDILERALLFLRRKRIYRCLDCWHRFYDRRLTKHP